MPCTEAQLLANQRNARKSTGPKTESGKRIARLNSLVHGMRSETKLVPKHLKDAVAKHTADLADAYRPEGGYQTWLIAQAADAAARLDSCQGMIRALFDDQIDRADLCWDEDHDRNVEELAARLPKDPARVVRRLRATARGCIWLLARWFALETALNNQEGWTEAQLDQAFQLLGVPEPQRYEYPRLTLDASPDHLTELVKEQIESLESLYVNAMHPLNLKERDLATLGIPLRPSAEMNKLQRYEGSLRRVYTESLNEFRRLRAEGFTGPMLVTALEPEPLRLPELPEAAIEAPPQEEPSRDLAAVKSMLAGVIAKIPAKLVPPPVPLNPSRSSVVVTPKAKGNRKARRAQEKAARKAKGQTR